MNPYYIFLGFGTALRYFDKALFYRWQYNGNHIAIRDFIAAYNMGEEL